MSKQLTGKVAFVTGSSKNMGKSFAIALAEQGADLVIHYHSAHSKPQAIETQREVEALGVKATLVHGDISNKAQVMNIFEHIISEFGGVDIVINNAGAISKKPFVEYTESDFDALFGINCKGAFFVMQAAAKHIRDNGRIINMATSLLAAFTGGYALYAGSKAPLEQFTKALAKEIGHRGVTVNTIAPGAIDTDFFHGEENPQTVDYLKSASVMNRLGQIDDVIPAVVYLASEASRWTTGQTLFINGGFVTR
ncbi:SDR family oxidoreductase [Pseudoalteromonas piscicida]|uniref:SDR family oxidoreductase n=1 Tax=Pseudoalteromonas piscicida TaxID=43662 RepID=UPI003098F4AD